MMVGKSGETLRASAERGWNQLCGTLDGVTQGQAWAMLPQNGPDFLHTDGTIHGIALHTATCKMAYASFAFHQTEIRWRDLADRMDSIEPDWDKAMAFIREAHEYWMNSWVALTDEQLAELVPTNYRDPWPADCLIDQMSHHDSYHAGQIAVLRYALPETTTPPPSVADDIRTYCRESVHW